MDPCYSLLHADTGEENISRHKMEAIVYHILIPMILKQGNHEDDHTPDPRYTLLKLYILPQSTKYLWYKHLSKMFTMKRIFFWKHILTVHLNGGITKI